MTRPWQIRLVADPIAERAFGIALEAEAQSIAAFETAPGGPWQIDAIFPAETAPATIEALLAAAAESLGRPPPLVVASPVPDVDWVAENQRSFPPLSIGRFHVRGSHVEGASPPGSWRIELDAGIAFGSGEHATTRGCLLAIAAAARRRVPRCALDLGCGSAILAIALARAGVPDVLASDIDRDLVRVAAENLALNGVVRQVHVLVSDGFARLPRRRGFDFVVANILAGPLVRLAPRLSRALAPGGRLVLSGLLAGQEREVVAAYRGQRLAFVGRRAIMGWHTLEFRRRASASTG